MKIERGDVFLAQLDPSRGHEIKKTRPVVIVTNDIANEFSKLVTVIPVTSQKIDRTLHFEVNIGKPEGLNKESKALVQQIRTLDKTRLVKKLSKLPNSSVLKIDLALKLHLALK